MQAQCVYFQKKKKNLFRIKCKHIISACENHKSWNFPAAKTQIMIIFLNARSYNSKCNQKVMRSHLMRTTLLSRVPHLIGQLKRIFFFYIYKEFPLNIYIFYGLKWTRGLSGLFYLLTFNFISSWYIYITCVVVRWWRRVRGCV